MAELPEQQGTIQKTERNTFKLSETEQRLMNENNQNRLLLEQLKILLNNSLTVEQLSLLGSAKFLITQLHIAEDKLEATKNDYKLFLKLLNQKDIHEAKKQIEARIRLMSNKNEVL